MKELKTYPSSEDSSKSETKKKSVSYKFILFMIVIIAQGAFIGYFYYERTQREIETANLFQKLKEAQPLIDRVSRIKHMEQTLIVHYKLSWYEAHYYSIIMDDFSQKYGIPWQVYAAVVRIESNFDPTLLSKKGARGMTQVIESTGRDVAGRLGIDFKSKKTLWNEIPNMVIGFTYLSEAIQEKGLEDGIRTYIGGPGFNKTSKLIGDYKTSVKWEFERLRYIHNGVISSDGLDEAESMVLAEVSEPEDG